MVFVPLSLTRQCVQHLSCRSVSRVHFHASKFVLASLVLLQVHVAASLLWSQPGGGAGRLLDQELKKSVERLTDNKYLLEYKFQKGEVLRYEVVHQVLVKTTIDGNTQTNRSRSKSTKLWNIRDAGPQALTFDHVIESVDMWSESQGKAPIKYNSKTDKDVPPEYEGVAKMIGKPIARVTMDRAGQVADRSGEVNKIDIGVGDIAIPLPGEPVPLGFKWTAPGFVKVRLTDGQHKNMKTQQMYRLEKVASGVATISVKTQVLTPVPDARVQSQLIQKLTNGNIRFDMDAGRVMSRQMDWDERVVGFSGPASNMSYLARLNEQLVAEPRVARGSLEKGE